MAEKPSLALDSTVAVTTKEVEELSGDERSDVDAGTKNEEAKPKEAAASAKPKLAKEGTMIETAKEAKALLGDDLPDPDASTRAQSKKINDLKSEKPAAKVAKKAKLSKAGTMVGTAKEGSALLGGEKLGDTRQVTKQTKARTSIKKSNSMKRTIEESSWTTGTDRVDTSAKRQLRKRKLVNYAASGDAGKANGRKANGSKKSKK